VNSGNWKTASKKKAFELFETQAPTKADQVFLEWSAAHSQPSFLYFLKEILKTKKN
jgi:hypothetical protein